MNKKPKRKAKVKLEAVRAYAFEFSEPPILCWWAEYESAKLKAGGFPSPEAKVVAVRIIREADYRRLLKAYRGHK